MSAHPRNALEDLLERMRHRMYSETIPTLTSYWLRAVYSADHNTAWWHETKELVKRALRDESLDTSARESLTELNHWMARNKLPLHHNREDSPQPDSYRDNVRGEWVAPYILRLLNEWLPAEASGLLVENDEAGIPVLTSGQAIERLLVRERLSPRGLEMLLSTEALSPRYVYPADLEMLHDIVLALIKRTWGPPLPALPATILNVSEDSSLPPTFSERVRHARIEVQQARETLHVPIEAEEARKILNDGLMHIGSILVGMDGRWWEAQRLLSGDCHAIVYKPGGRLRIDYSRDHMRMTVPFPQPKPRWPGNVHFGAPIELFGREWHAASWESDGQHAWLHLVFSRVLPAQAVHQAGEAPLLRSHPASVDMAWAALGDALAAALEQKSEEPIEKLRRNDFIPLGRVLLRFAKATAGHSRPNSDAIATELRAIRFYQAKMAAQYGRIPWRVFPQAVQANSLRGRLDPASLEIFSQVFDGVPETWLVAA